MVSRSCRCCASFSANTGSPATAAATAFACGPESWPSAKAINVSSSIFIGGLRLSTAQRPDERGATAQQAAGERADRDRSEEHTSELQSLMRISYAVFCLKKKKHK